MRGLFGNAKSHEIFDDFVYILLQKKSNRFACKTSKLYCTFEELR